MPATLTVRTGEALRQALVERAAATGKTVSQLVREILTDALAERSIASRAGHLRGRLEAPSDADDAWRRRLRERNWRR